MPKTNPRYLTKSRFKLALECPTKLRFTSDPEYGNTKADDHFLKALAQGGFQVGALAKLYFPQGIEVHSQDYGDAVLQTAELLKLPEVVIFEAALVYKNLFVRVDILEKKKNQINLYEVKSKSYSPEDEFMRKDGKGLLATWEEYIYDIAFQKHIAQKVLPAYQVNAFLYLADKTATTSVDGLNQNFRLTKNKEGRSTVQTKTKFTPEQLGTPILKAVNIEKEIAHVFTKPHGDLNFEAWTDYLAKQYQENTLIPPTITSQCKNCEFRIPEEERQKGIKSGFHECWEKQTKKPIQDQALVIDLWNYRGSDKIIEDKRYLLKQITEQDIEPQERKEDQGEGLSLKQRQWLQVKKEKENDQTPFLDKASLKKEMATWKYPLHFIDFETSTSAIPFHKGRRPYEQVAFQYSHHTVQKDGTIEHKGQYLHFKKGEFPNFEFLKELKKELTRDQGTIFRYAPHENTILCAIHAQLKESDHPEKEDLQAFIEQITKKKETKEVLWEGKRNMVDLLDLVKRYYYSPRTQGSNSLKYILPAVLNESKYLQEKYKEPIYGSTNGIKSHNYKNKIWIQRTTTGEVQDPYKTLDPIFTKEEDETIERLFPETELADGGAAMMAYARLQFSEMSDAEAAQIQQALLRYCELDTLAMVMLYEYWKNG